MRRFWDKIDTTPGQGSAGSCWGWMAGVKRDGYGRFWFRSQTWHAHRVVWTLTRGEIPEGLCVLHNCDNPGCCNPDHLFLGTNADNMADKVMKGRHAYKIHLGEKNGRAKLTDEKVREILGRWAAGVTQVQLGREYGVSQPLISGIVRGKAWKHV